MFGRFQRHADHQRKGGDGDVRSRPFDLGPPDGQHEVRIIRHIKALPVEDFVFQEYHRIGVADGRFQQTLGVRPRPRRDHLEPRDMGEPRGVALRVLGGDAGGGAVGTAEDDRRPHLPARHVERLGRRVDDLVHGLHGEVEGHEFDDRLQAAERRADAEPCEAVLGDRGVDHPLGAEFLQQALTDLVGALVLGDFLAHQVDPLVAAHFLGHGVAQRIADGEAHHGAVIIGFRRRLGGRRRGWRGRGWGRRGRRRSLRFRLWGRLRRRGGRRGGGFNVRYVLAFLGDDGDRRVDGDVLGPFGNQDLAQCPLVHGLDFHGRLVGFDLGQDVAAGDGVAFAFKPFGDLAFGHGRRQRRHQDLRGHVTPSRGPD